MMRPRHNLPHIFRTSQGWSYEPIRVQHSFGQRLHPPNYYVLNVAARNFVRRLNEKFEYVEEDYDQSR